MYCTYRGCQHGHGYTKKASLQFHLQNHSSTSNGNRQNKVITTINSTNLLLVPDSPFAVWSPNDLLLCLECGEGIEMKEDTRNPGQSHLRQQHSRSGYDVMKTTMLELLGARKIYRQGFYLVLIG